MKQYIICECETYGKRSEDQAEIIACEAAHTGLTVAEKHEWEELKRKCQDTARTVSYTNNEMTQKTLDDSIEALLEFEENHSLLIVL